MHVLVTGAAGFIGFHLSKRLLELGHSVVGLDSLNDYYSVELKRDRLAQVQDHENFTFVHMDLADRLGMKDLFATSGFTHVVNLAAQAGVRYSVENPDAYVDANLVGFANVLEGCRHNKVEHLVYASSSSVYGMNTRMPLSPHESTEHPMSLYAATKKAGEMMAHAYSNLYGLPTTGLRFFTVYGPWGRPDMALFLFTKAILEGKPIKVFNHGKMERDFTYVDDIVEGVVRVVQNVAAPNPKWTGRDPDPASSPVPYRIYNIGNNNKVQLTRYIEVLEQKLGKTAEKIFMDLQPGDVPATWADVDDLVRDVDFCPSISVEEGISRFVAWYREYFKV